jgi:hypothetical protein
VVLEDDPPVPEDEEEELLLAPPEFEPVDGSPPHPKSIGRLITDTTAGPRKLVFIAGS